ncbi:hypothetical protein S349_21 [Shewanella sp. phage 3/49]|uniref:hypothetical protein n=1 Tax=Shewanella sp. phage 3/49 TaxID=1458863 RepID=UPI0004F91674|nr:hypothetical protein S349_21 [Shewanella sp. phage 3/49]AHK11811.1 hypothetical protein S349_21 [Shewanella sp. phage 3/49]
MKKFDYGIIKSVVFGYVAACLFCSVVRIMPEIKTCDEAYPIDYIIFSKLFCEIK